MVLTKLGIPQNAESTYPLPEDIDHLSTDTNSWFTSNKPENIVNYSEKITKKLCCKQIQLKPTEKQAELLRQWMHIYRSVYNYTISYIRHNEKNETCKFLNVVGTLPEYYQYNKNTLRNIIKKSFPESLRKVIETSKIPVHSMDNAINDVAKAYKSASSLAKKNKRPFRIRCKRPGSTLSMVFEARAHGKRESSILPVSMRPMKAIYTENGENIEVSLCNIDHDCRLVENNKGQFILYIPIDKETAIPVNRQQKCSLDPGLRVFQTVYALNNGIPDTYNIGTNLQCEIGKILNKIDKTKQQKNQTGCSKFYRKQYDKIKHKVEDLHWKTAKYLATKYETIYIGDMGTRSIVSRNLDKTTKRILQLVSHYTFRLRLEHKCEQYNTKFVVVDESYTSKTCGNCGRLTNVGSSKTFTCKTCNFVIDRDINGARNIMIKQENPLLR